MSAIHAPHGEVHATLTYTIKAALTAIGSTWRPMLCVSTRLSEHNLVEPDIVVVTKADDGLLAGEAVYLAVEVASLTLRHDLGAKAKAYAGAGVPEYWVVDVGGRVIHQLGEPCASTHLRRALVPVGETVAAATVAGLTVTTHDL
ncbi:Uma2 family endonuclease [Sphingomonas sp. DT-51]|uniref:Uma2 family endonuclease n=1 Tax=Sphingomonas sp. DT-51 TaxID=3396165 RepID=UPI003F1B0471